MLSMTEWRELSVRERSCEILSSRVLSSAKASLALCSMCSRGARSNAGSGLILFGGVCGGGGSLVGGSEAADVMLEGGRGSARWIDGAVGMIAATERIADLLSRLTRQSRLSFGNWGCLQRRLLKRGGGPSAHLRVSCVCARGDYVGHDVCTSLFPRIKNTP